MNTEAEHVNKQQVKDVKEVGGEWYRPQIKHYGQWVPGRGTGLPPPRGSPWKHSELSGERDVLSLKKDVCVSGVDLSYMWHIRPFRAGDHGFSKPATRVA